MLRFRIIDFSFSHRYDKLIKHNVTATRERVAGEIIPVSVEQSATLNNDEANNGAGLAIDLDPITHSYSAAGADGTIWLKLTLEKVDCVQHVIWYHKSNPYQTWTCSKTSCNCVGEYCELYTLTVSTEGTVSDLSPVSDCKYGDTVKLEKVSGYHKKFAVYEIAIVGKPGKSFK